VLVIGAAVAGESAGAVATAAVALGLAVAACLIAVRMMQGSTNSSTWDFEDHRGWAFVAVLLALQLAVCVSFSAFILAIFELPESQRLGSAAGNRTCQWEETPVGQAEDIGSYNWDAVAFQLSVLFAATSFVSSSLAWLPLLPSVALTLSHFVANIMIVLAMGRECHSIPLSGWFLANVAIGVLALALAYRSSAQSRKDFVMAVQSSMNDTSFDATELAIRFFVNTSSDIICMLQHASADMAKATIVMCNAAALEVLGKNAQGRQIHQLIDSRKDQERFMLALQASSVSSFAQKAVQSSRNILQTGGVNTSNSTIPPASKSALSQTSTQHVSRREVGLPQRSRSFLDDDVVTEEVLSSAANVEAAPTSVSSSKHTAVVVPIVTSDSSAAPIPLASWSGDTVPANLSAQADVRRCGFKSHHGLTLDADVFLHAVSKTKTIVFMQPSAGVQRVTIPKSSSRRTLPTTASVEASNQHHTGTAEWSDSVVLQELNTESDMDDADQLEAMGGRADHFSSAPQAWAASDLPEAETATVQEVNHSTADEPLRHKKNHLKSLLSSQRILLLERDQGAARAAMRLLRKNGAVGTLVNDASAIMAAYRSSMLAARMHKGRDFTCMVLNSEVPDVSGTVQALRSLGFEAPIIQIAPAASTQINGASLCILQPLMPNKLANALAQALST